MAKTPLVMFKTLQGTRGRPDIGERGHDCPTKVNCDCTFPTDRRGAAHTPEIGKCPAAATTW
jgi:hypothetical protein